MRFNFRKLAFVPISIIKYLSGYVQFVVQYCLKDAVAGDETVRVPQYFINGTEVIRIDFGAGYKAVLGWRIVPAEAA